jgi:phenylacetic acid degradation operon negative regulatory protein
MRTGNEELLYFLLWSADTLMRPTWRNLTDPFETWAWRNGLSRRLAELERRKLIEARPQPDLGRVVRLTGEGRRRALGGRDPIARWNRAWDGRWRLVMFDLPSERSDLRQQVWRTLRHHDFGYLQLSVWATPDSNLAVRSVLGSTKVQPDAFLVIEGRPAAGESDQEIVEACWNFGEINAGYEKYLAFLSQDPPTDARLPGWARRENAAWRAAIWHDPLLPKPLLPPSYLGPVALQRRKTVLGRLAGIIDTRVNP